MTDGLIWKKQSKDVDACVRKVEGQLLCDVWKEKIRRIRGRWFTSPWQSYSLVTSPPKRPATAAWCRRRPWCSQSICHTGPTKLRKKKDAPSFPCAGLHSHGFHLPSPSSFLNFLRDYRCCISSSYNQTISVPSPHHSASFLYSPLWLCASDPLNCFSLSILKVCLLPMISQSLTHSFCSTLHSLIWFTQLPPPICAALGPIPFPLQNHPWYLFDCHQEKGEAVSWALSKAVHPSLFEVWRQCCSEISAALTETRGRRVRGEALKQ